LNEEEKDRLLLDHPEYASLIHYVRSSSKQSGYWRVKPFTYSNPTPRQQAHQLEFSKIAYDNYGKKGFVDGVPVIDHEIGKALRRKQQMGEPQKQANLRLRLNKLALSQGIHLRIQMPKLRIKI